MVVVGSSALIPLAWVGRLELVPAVFDDVQTSRIVEEEVIVEGKRGVGPLERFLDGVSIADVPSCAAEVAEMEGIAIGDASVVLLAADEDEPLVANDRALMGVARSHGVDTWWVTTLLLACESGRVDWRWGKRCAVRSRFGWNEPQSTGVRAGTTGVGGVG